MTLIDFKGLAGRAALLIAIGSAVGCHERDSVQIVTVSLANTAIYQFPTVGGDEESARITTQAEHQSVSEIRRSAETGFVATYVYQPAPGFVGSDEAEIEVATGSNGATAPTAIKRIAFHFAIHD